MALAPSLPATLTLLLLLFIFISTSLAAPVPITGQDIIDWFQNAGNYALNYEKNTLENTKCYALPVGTLGWISMILEGYTIFCHADNRRPLAFWSHQTLTQPFIGGMLAVVTGILTIPIPAFTVYKCRQNWQLICIAVYKLANVVALAGVGLHRALSSNPKGLSINKAQDFVKAAWVWLFIYVLSFLGSNAGTFDLIAKFFHINVGVRVVTYVHIGIAGGVTVALVGVFTVFKWMMKKTVGKVILVVGMVALAMFGSGG